MARQDDSCQGRDFGDWLGLVPKQESTGDRTILGKISKRGNKYLRTRFVQAAHVVLARRPDAAKRGLWPWIEQVHLLRRLDRHEAHRRPLHRFRDRFGVAVVVLVPFEERLHVLCWD